MPEIKPREDGIIECLEPQMPSIPDASGFSSLIQSAFDPLIKAQRKRVVFTLRLPLISIRKQLIP
jgi:hypothetical protein